MSQVAVDVLSDAGVTIVPGAVVTAIADGAGDALVRWEAAGTAHESRAEAVLLALGREPATDGLGLEAAGIDVDGRGYVVVDDLLRTSAVGVWAVGDVNGGPQFTYVSLDDSRIVADQLFGEGRRSRSDRVAVPRTTFLTPPLARVGLTERAARATGARVRVATRTVASIAGAPRPKIDGDPRGIIKVVVDADSDLVLGASLLHVHSDEVINLLALAMRHGVTATELRDGIYTHPSATEALNDVLGSLGR